MAESTMLFSDVELRVDNVMSTMSTTAQHLHSRVTLTVFALCISSTLCMAQNKQDKTLYYCLYLRQMLTDFQNSLIDMLANLQ